MADYFRHWINIGKQTHIDKLPKIFNVNWFRTNQEGNFLWPGFGENSRVLKWIFERVDNQNNNNAIETPIGWIPNINNFDTSNLNEVNSETLQQLFKVDKKEWLNELDTVSTYFNKTFGRRLPKQLTEQINKIKSKVSVL